MRLKFDELGGLYVLGRISWFLRFNFFVLMVIVEKVIGSIVKNELF